MRVRRLRGGAWKRAGRGRRAKPVLERYGRVPEGAIRRRGQASSARVDDPHQASSSAVDLTVLLGALVASTAIAAALGAANLGTALSFGQIGFAAALVWVLLRR
jgi:hypothetical protein